MIIVALIFKTISIINNTVSVQRQRYKELLRRASDVKRMQSDFEHFYNHTVTILKSSGARGGLFNRGSGADVTGFSLPGNIVDPNINFNLQLSDTEKIKESQAAVEKYQKVLGMIEVTIQKDLTKHLENLATLVNRLQNNDRGGSFSFQNTNRSSSIVLSRNADRDFYREERLIENKLMKLFAAVDNERHRLQNRTLENDILDFRKYLKFISENLLSNRDVQKISGHQGATADRTREEKSREIQFAEIFYNFLMQHLPELYNANNWKITHKLDILQGELKKLYNQAERHEEACKDEYKVMALAIVLQWLIFLLTILGIMVLADFLRAHFDNAHNTFK